LNRVIAPRADTARQERIGRGGFALDNALHLDPSGHYLLCDALTLTAYHCALSEMAQWSGKDVLEVAHIVVSKSKHAVGRSGKEHVGYYLIGQGRPEMERIVGARVPMAIRTRRFLRSHAVATYFAIVACVTTTLLLYLHRAILAGLLFVPILRTAAVIAQVSLHPWFVPRRLPRLHVPADSPVAARCAIVLPAIISAEDDLDEAITTLEQNYLNLEGRRAVLMLLTDFRDAQQEELPEDSSLSELIKQRLELLNARHGGRGAKPFHHLHRRRIFSTGEGKWMGWERKRGKLVELCRLIAEGAVGSFSNLHSLELDPSQLDYIITLDADSVLEPGGVAALIGTMAHPLNTPRWIEGRVRSGYGLIRPRSVPTTDSSTGLFFELMYGAARRVPPQRELYPSFYQDVVDADMFFGKGIVHIRAFAACVAGRIPSNLVLSHDHLEGLFARTGFSSDILLFGEFPIDTHTWRLRQHRWIRGDTQSGLWMLPWVPSPEGWVRSPLSSFDRWRLAKNLIEHASAPHLLLTAVVAWLGVFGGNSGLEGCLAILGIAAWPAITCAATLIEPNVPVPVDGSRIRVNRLAELGRICRYSVLNWLWVTVLLIDTSLIVADATTRSIFRMVVSKRRLLEWNTAAAVRRAGARRTVGEAWLEMSGSVTVASALTCAIWLLRPESLPWAAPFLVCWLAAPQLAFLVKAKSTEDCG